MRANEFITEVFAPGKKNWEWKFRGSEEAIANFTVGGRTYQWVAYSHVRIKNPTKWEIQFRLLREDNDPDELDVFGTTGTGNSAEVLSTAVDITRTFLKEYGDKVLEITFNAKENSRIGLYAKMIKRLLPDWDLHQRYVNNSYGMEFYLTNPKAYELHSQSKEIDEDINRRNLLKGVAGAAALGATGLAKAGEYQDLETIKKQPDVWMPRFEQLQQRSNGMLGKLMRAAGPEWAQRLKGSKVLVMSNDQWVQGNADNRTVSLDLTVFWDAPDSTLAFAIAHELGHIALGHGFQPDPGQARREEMDADDFAIRLCRALGYNKVEMFKFLHQKQSDYDFYNSITKLPNSSHPSYDQRIKRADQKGFQLSKGGVQQMNTLMTHLA